MIMSFDKFLRSLEVGDVRAAEKINGTWVVNSQVKQGILSIFKESAVISMGNGFIDKEPLRPRVFGLDENVRVVPGGTSIRPGAYLGPRVVVMPPAFINIGAFIDEACMIDSHVLVGSCAQIGKRVHLSTAVQIGGVLEPVGAMPVIIEDDAFIGAGALITEGVLVSEGAVIAPNVSLSASVPIFDVINQRISYGVIPPLAVVVPGARPVSDNLWAKNHNLSLSCAVIIKYRDQKTAAALELEKILRA